MRRTATIHQLLYFILSYFLEYKNPFETVKAVFPKQSDHNAITIPAIIPNKPHVKIEYSTMPFEHLFDEVFASDRVL